MYSKRSECSRLVGVEWEFNYPSGSRASPDLKPVNDWVARWRGSDVHSDVSCGLEAVTPPMVGTDIRKCLRELAAAFDGAEATCNKQCSIHVHVDARDVTWSDMLRLLVVYAKLEPALYLLAGQNRLGSKFCRPCGDEYIAALSQSDRRGGVLAVAMSDEGGRRTDYMGARNMMRGSVSKKSNGRYKGLNIMPWIAGRSLRETVNVPVKTYMVNVPGKKDKVEKKTTGIKRVHRMANDTTVEFRIHRNTQDPDRVANWAMLCSRIVEWTVKHTDDEAEALPASAMRALAVIAPDSVKFILKRISDWRYVTRRNGGIKRRIQFNKGTWSGKRFTGDGTYKIIDKAIRQNWEEF